MERNFVGEVEISSQDERTANTDGQRLYVEDCAVRICDTESNSNTGYQDESLKTDRSDEDIEADSADANVDAHDLTPGVKTDSMPQLQPPVNFESSLVEEQASCQVPEHCPKIGLEVSKSVQKENYTICAEFDESRNNKQRVFFDVQSALHMNDHSGVIQTLTTSGELTVKRSSNNRNTICNINFTELHSGSGSDRHPAPYSQFFVEVKVDSQAVLAHTSIQNPQQTRTYAGRLLTSTGEFKHSVWIRLHELSGEAVMEFSIDDPCLRKGLFGMSEFELPEVEFRFFDGPARRAIVPATTGLRIEVTSHWSMNPHVKPQPSWFTELISGTAPTSSFPNISQAVVIEIPFPLTQTANQAERLDVQLHKLQHGHLSRKRYQDGPNGFQVSSIISESTRQAPA